MLKKIFKIGERIKAANVLDIKANYSYFDGKYYMFMNNETFEQYTANDISLHDSKQWIKPQDNCMLTLFNNQVISVIAPNFVELKIRNTDPGYKGNMTGTGTKLAILETGAIVPVPLFVQIGKTIKINTRTGKYISRFKLLQIMKNRT